MRALDWLSFCLADVQSGLGPFVAVYLVTIAGWDAESIGLVLTTAGVATLIAQTPAGAVIDATHRKRSWIIIAAALVSTAAFLVTLAPTLSVMTITQVVSGAAAAVFPPALAAIALGLVGPGRFTYRMGRIQAFNHSGNVAAALLAGVVGYLLGVRAVFWLVSLLGIGVIGATFMIKRHLIDDEIARGLRPQDEQAGQPSAWMVLLARRPLLVFSITAMLFHLANAAMLPVIGQQLTVAHRGKGTLLMSALIITAQAVMVPMSILIGRRADAWGRKPIFLAAFAALPIRGVLLTLSGDPYYLVSVQVLDGVGAGIFDALFPLVIADLTRGTGRYNVALGAATTMKGIGAALSTMLAGTVIVVAGYRSAFLVLACIAVLALVLYAAGVPETSSRRFRPGEELTG